MTDQQTENPFDDDYWFRVLSSESDCYEAFLKAIQRLRYAIATVAEEKAKQNAAWHDDPEADDHAAFHAPHDVQFTQEQRLRLLRTMFDYYTRELLP